MDKPNAESLRGRDVVLALLVLGSAWGLLEVVLGGAMKSASIPFKGDLLTGLGIGIMAVAIAWFRKPLLVVAIAAIAVALKQLAVPILHLPFMCKANSCLAVMLAGGALAGTATAVGGRLHKGHIPRIATGFAACLLGSVGFYFIGMRAAPCKYLLSFNRPGGFAAFLGAEGLIWAGLGAVFLPLGYRVGLALQPKVYDLHVSRPAVYYAASAAIIACAWIGSGIAIAAGL